VTIEQTVTTPAPPAKAVRTELGLKWVRAYLGGAAAADSRRTLLVWEIPYYPTYFFPAADVPAELVPTGVTAVHPLLGVAQVCDVRSGDRTVRGAALYYTGEEAAEQVRETVRLDWDAMDDWFEENEPVYVHARDPHTRVDVLASSRHVRVEVDGVRVAESRSPRILFETGLPPRYYLALTDVDRTVLRPSDLRTQCPYKGEATYFSVEVAGARYEDLVWIYRTPLAESAGIAGLVSFYPDRATVYVDGVRI
jgi:uncharacterized protein (DUF427 family)